MYNPEVFLYVCCVFLNKDKFWEDFSKDFQKISCPLTDTIKMKWSAPNSQMVVLGIASVPCCEREGSAFLQILEWMIISCYILKGSNFEQSTPPHTHTTQLEQCLRSMFSFKFAIVCQ